MDQLFTGKQTSKERNEKARFDESLYLSMKSKSISKKEGRESLAIEDGIWNTRVLDYEVVATRRLRPPRAPRWWPRPAPSAVSDER